MSLPIPQSLYNPTGASAADRRVLAGISADPLIVGPVATPNGFDFVDGGGGNDQIVRNDGGSWLEDGFVVGKTVTVANATTVANNGSYTILAATDDTLDVVTASFTADADDNTATFTTTGIGPGVTGVHTRNHKWLHVAAESVGAAASFDLTLYARCKFSGVWGVVAWFGTAGTVSITTAGGPVVVEPLLIAGIDEVYPHANNFAGGGTANVWLAGSTPDGAE